MNIRTLADIRSLGTIVGVWAHPDDETFSCAGLMAAAVRNGQRVVCITATKGEEGTQDATRWSPEDMGDIRTAELAAALEILGISEHHWLGYRDGTCAEVDSVEAVSKLAGLLQGCRPDTVLTFGPEGLTGHSDHQTVSGWAHTASKQLAVTPTIYHVVESRSCYENCFKEIADRHDFFFNIDEPPLRDDEHCDICLALPEELLDKKMRALAAMPSQTALLFESSPRDQLEGSFCMECFEQAGL